MIVHHKILSMKWQGVLLLLPGWDASPSQDAQHEVTRSITTPPGWDASRSQDTQHEVTRSIATPTWIGCWSVTGYPAGSDLEYYYSPPPFLDGMLVHHRMPNIQWLEILFLPLDGKLVRSRIPPSTLLSFPDSLLVTIRFNICVDRDNLNALPKNTTHMTPARLWSCTTWSTVRHEKEQASVSVLIKVS